jgi:hypothetical protein
VADALMRLHKDKALYDVISELGATQFIPATAADYAGSERLLRGVFGYQALQGRAAPPAPTLAPGATQATAPQAVQGLSIKAERGR